MTNSIFTAQRSKKEKILNIRLYGGFNAASCLGGLAALLELDSKAVNRTAAVCLPDITADIKIVPHEINHIKGIQATLTVPDQAHCRGIGEIIQLYEASGLTPGAKTMAKNIWMSLAQAEANVHGFSVDATHFHEIGRLSNVVAIGLIAQWTDQYRLSFYASPVPMTDSVIHCAHGCVAYPAPAMREMLHGIPVYAFEGHGEPITPTGLAILIGLNATFGQWPAMTVDKIVTSYTNQIYQNAPNGALMAIGDYL